MITLKNTKIGKFNIILKRNHIEYIIIVETKNMVIERVKTFGGLKGANEYFESLEHKYNCIIGA